MSLKNFLTHLFPLLLRIELACLVNILSALRRVPRIGPTHYVEEIRKVVVPHKSEYYDLISTYKPPIHVLLHALLHFLAVFKFYL